MKQCLVCNAISAAIAHTCAQCGCQDWRPIAPKSAPPAPPSESANPTRDKRNR